MSLSQIHIKVLLIKLLVLLTCMFTNADSLLLAAILIVAAYGAVKTAYLPWLRFAPFRTGYEPNTLPKFDLGKVTFIIIYFVGSIVAQPASPATALYKVNPTKNIPMLVETNYHEWSWRISSAFIAIGMASSCLFLSQTSTEPKDEELESSDITTAREEISEAEVKLDSAGSACAELVVERLQSRGNSLQATKLCFPPCWCLRTHGHCDLCCEPQIIG